MTAAEARRSPRHRRTPRTTTVAHRAARVRRGDTAGAGAEDGFTLIEALVSFILLAIVTSSAVYALTNGIGAADSSNRRVTAANLAQANLQLARGQVSRGSTPIYPAAMAAQTITEDDKTYTLTRTLSPATGCTAPAGTAAPSNMIVLATVTWNGASQPIQVGTEIAC